MVSSPIPHRALAPLRNLTGEAPADSICLAILVLHMRTVKSTSVLPTSSKRLESTLSGYRSSGSPTTFLVAARKYRGILTKYMEYSGHSVVLAICDTDVDKFEMTSALMRLISLHIYRS